MINITVDNLPITIYPIEDKLKDMGFYSLVHLSTRYEEVNKSVVQITLFKADKPYLHEIQTFKYLINTIELKNNKYVSALCDEAIYELAKISKKGIINEEINNRKEDLNKLINKYAKYLSNISEIQYQIINECIFEKYINNEINIDTVELLLKAILVEKKS